MPREKVGVANIFTTAGRPSPQPASVQQRFHENTLASRFMEGTTGKEFEIKSTKPKGYVCGRVIVINNRLYEVFAGGTDARLTSPDVRKFLDPFKLIRYTRWRMPPKTRGEGRNTAGVPSLTPRLSFQCHSLTIRVRTRPYRRLPLPEPEQSW